MGQGRYFLHHSFKLGGYPVLKKWLGYRDVRRRGGPLTLQEAEYFRQMVRRLTAILTSATKQWELLTHEESERPIKAATNSPGTGSLGLHNLSRSYHG